MTEGMLVGMLVGVSAALYSSPNSGGWVGLVVDGHRGWVGMMLVLQKEVDTLGCRSSE